MSSPFAAKATDAGVTTARTDMRRPNASPGLPAGKHVSTNRSASATTASKTAARRGGQECLPASDRSRAQLQSLRLGREMRRLRRGKNGRTAALLLRQHGTALWSVQNRRVTPNGLRDVGTLEADVLQQPIIQSQQLALGLARSSPGPGFGQKATKEHA